MKRGSKLKSSGEENSKRKKNQGKNIKKKKSPHKNERKKKIPEYKEVEISGLKILNIKLHEIDLTDETFRFRVKLKVGKLASSLAQEGQQFPIVLRKKKDGKLQIISGFRRIAAIQKLGWETVKAVIREDLEVDTEACKVSILENEIRQTYNDLDRAYAILAYRKMGNNSAEIEEIFKVGIRQRQRLEALIKFPKELQEAVAGKDISLSHAVRLMQFIRKNPRIKVQKWIDWIVKNEATFSQLNAALNSEADAKSKKQQTKLFQETKGKNGKKAIRMMPISIKPGMSKKHKEALQKEFQKLLEIIEAM